MKIEVPGKDTSIFVDDQWVGTSGNIMKLAVDAGTHTIELRDNQGNSIYKGDIQVDPGKTTELRPDIK